MKLLPTANDSRRVFLWVLLFAVSLTWLAQGAAPEAVDIPEGSSPAAPLSPAVIEPPPAPTALPSAETPPPPPGQPAPITPPPAQAVQSPVDIFSVRTWQPPPPVAPVIEAKPESPPRPQAPPLPFRFLGKITEADKDLTFLLARGDRVISVSVGQVINGTYLVEKHDAGRLYFIYKPLKIRQSISVGRQS
jgi:hypothetical protein